MVLGWKVGLLLLQLFPNGGATDIVFVTLFCIAVGTAIAWCGSHCTTADGHCLVTLSITVNETLKWLSSLPILMQESFWW